MKTAAEWIMHWSTEKFYNLHDLVHGVRDEAIAHARQECAAEIERLKAELAALREQQPPAPAPQEPTESPLDKAAREACEHHCGIKVSPSEWSRGAWDQAREAWRRVVVPIFLDEPPKPVKSDGDLLLEAIRESFGMALWSEGAAEDVADTFRAKRAERDGTTTTDNRKAVK